MALRNLWMSPYLDSANACLYALNDDELSMRAQYSLRPSVILFCHSSRRIGAESRADNRAWESNSVLLVRLQKIFYIERLD